MSTNNVIAVRCDMLYGNDPCKSVEHVRTWSHRGAFIEAHRLGWTRFLANVTPVEVIDGVVVESEYRYRWQFDACPLCSALIPPMKGKYAKTALSGDLLALLMERATEHAMVSGIIPGPPLYVVRLVGGVGGLRRRSFSVTGE